MRIAEESLHILNHTIVLFVSAALAISSLEIGVNRMYPLHVPTHLVVPTLATSPSMIGFRVRAQFLSQVIVAGPQGNIAYYASSRVVALSSWPASDDSNGLSV